MVDDKQKEMVVTVEIPIDVEGITIGQFQIDVSIFITKLQKDDDKYGASAGLTWDVKGVFASHDDEVLCPDNLKPYVEEFMKGDELFDAIVDNVLG